MKMSHETAVNLAKAVLVLALVAGFLLCLHLRERTFRERMRAACPSGTAERVCAQTEADMMREPFGRVCVRFSRWIGGAK